MDLTPATKKRKRLALQLTPGVPSFLRRMASNPTVEQYRFTIGSSMVRTTASQCASCSNSRHAQQVGSISTAGTLTLAEDLLALPIELVESVVVHELLHLKFPDHRKGRQVRTGLYLPEWRTLSEQLIAHASRTLSP